MFRTRVSVTTLVVALAAAACGGTATTSTDPPDTAAGTSSASFPYTVESGGVRTVVASQPVAIVSLSPTATEMLFAIGAGPQVVAVDEYSYHPPEAPVTDLSGFTPNLEAIASYGPDLVVVSDDIDGIASALDEVGIPVLVLPTATMVDDAYRQIRVLGGATGRVEEAETLASDMQAEIEALVAGVAGSPGPLTYYHELGSDGGGSFYSVTSSTFVGEVFGAFGLENVADPADVDGFGYPVLSVEFIIDADPDLIFYTSCCGDTPETISARPGWDSIEAVRSGALYELDDDLSSRWGPRLVEFFRIVAEALRR
ncbi:MAG TPA: ABC transporter substrate-binding protein [Acidimicrobiia bacterium]|nr:ABC transporter substrate-binding protein [Acidimicrobiia bacterium]